MGELRMGILLWNQASDWPAYAKAAARVEELGYEHLWTWDHLLAIFGRTGIDAATVVLIGTLFGPAQVAARICEFAFGRNLHPLVVARAAISLLVAAFAMLAGATAVLLYAGATAFGFFSNEYGFHPGGDARVWAARPISYAITSVCADCHNVEAARLNSNRHAPIGCQSCPGPLEGHVNEATPTTASVRSRNAVSSLSNKPGSRNTTSS